MTMMKLTISGVGENASYKTIEVNSDDISEVLPNNGTYIKWVNAVVIMENGNKHGVVETVEQIDKIRTQKE